MISLIIEGLVGWTGVTSVVLELIDGSISGADLALEDSGVPQRFLGRTSRLSIRNLIDARFTSRVVDLVFAAHDDIAFVGGRIVEVPAVAGYKLCLTLFSSCVVIVSGGASGGPGLALACRGVIV